MFSSYNDNENYIIDDVRFKNEADIIKEKGGILIRLEGDPKGIRAKDLRDPNHISEIALDDYDKFDIKYNSDKDYLEDLLNFIKSKMS
jgi:hypothetical protein